MNGRNGPHGGEKDRTPHPGHTVTLQQRQEGVRCSEVAAPGSSSLIVSRLGRAVLTTGSPLRRLFSTSSKTSDTSCLRKEKMCNFSIEIGVDSSKLVDVIRLGNRCRLAVVCSHGRADGEQGQTQPESSTASEMQDPPWANYFPPAPPLRCHPPPTSLHI